MHIKQKYAMRLRHKLKRFPGNGYFKYLDGIAEPDLTSRILVEIPAYRDPELIPTMRAALAMAANPERVCFAVCFQGDDDVQAGRAASFPRTRIKRIPEDEVAGSCTARYEASRLWDGEEYVMHIDSHMRFASFWDVCVIDQYNRCQGSKKALTSYCMDYAKHLHDNISADVFDANARTRGLAVGFGWFTDNLFKPRCRPGTWFDGPDPIKGAFVCAHFLFGRPDIDIDVPLDPDTYFSADEALMALRLWTHGYEIWHPGVSSVYHLYYRSEATGAVRFSSNALQNIKQKSEAERMEQIFGVAGHGINLGVFGAGTERTIEAYYAYAGVNYRSRMARRFAYDGRICGKHDDSDMAPVVIDGAAITDKNHPMAHVDLKGVHSDVFFVIVTAYKAHGELAETVRSLFQNADNPERVRVLVVAQLTDEDYLSQARDLGAQVILCEPKGAGHAHYMGEEYIPEEASYVLYSEEHMYYVYGWDTALACYMHYCGMRAVISDWANGFAYDKPRPVRPADGCIICARGMLPHGHILIHYGRNFSCGRPVRGAFIIGHNLVVPAAVAKEVRHSPDMYLNSNESYMTYRYWCAGVDVYHAPKRYCYHYYAPARNGSGDVARSMEHSISVPRMKYLLGLPGGNPLADMQFALDSARSMQSFISFSGADPFNGTCSIRAQIGTFADDTGHDFVPARIMDSRKDGTDWASKNVPAILKNTVDLDAVPEMSRADLEALCSGNGPFVDQWSDSILSSYGGRIFGLPGTKLALTSGVRVILHKNARIFLLDNMVFNLGCIIDVHACADLVLGGRYMNVNGVIDCWRRIDILDTIIGPNTFISDGFACDIKAPDGRELMPVKQVSIGPHVWAASNVGIFPGTVMKNAAAGSMAVVKGIVRDNTVVAGNPMRTLYENCHWHG